MFNYKLAGNKFRKIKTFINSFFRSGLTKENKKGKVFIFSLPPEPRKVFSSLQERRIKMALQWIKTFCPCCKKVVRFEFIGIMKGKTKTLNLFNCSECHTTRHFSSFNTEAEKPQPVPSL